MLSVKKVKKGYVSLEVLVILSIALSLSSAAILRTSRNYEITNLEEQATIKEMS